MVRDAGGKATATTDRERSGKSSRRTTAATVANERAEVKAHSHDERASEPTTARSGAALRSRASTSETFPTRPASVQCHYCCAPSVSERSQHQLRQQPVTQQPARPRKATEHSLTPARQQPFGHTFTAPAPSRTAAAPAYVPVRGRASAGMLEVVTSTSEKGSGDFVPTSPANVRLLVRHARRAHCAQGAP